MKHNLKHLLANATAFIKTEAGKGGRIGQIRDSLEQLDIGQAKVQVDLLIKNVEELKTNLIDEFDEFFGESPRVGDIVQARGSLDDEWTDCVLLDIISQDGMYELWNLKEKYTVYWTYIK